MVVQNEEHYELAARHARDKLGIREQPCPDAMTLITKMKRLGWIENYERVPDKEMPEDEAEFNPDTRLLRIRESTFCAANGGDPRARWTIAHEIGHIALGHKKTRHRGAPNKAESVKPVKKDDAEANRFAEAFLAPYDLSEFTLGMTAEQLAARFQISVTAARIRLPMLERMHRRTHGIQRPEPKAVTEFLKGHKGRR